MEKKNRQWLIILVVGLAGLLLGILCGALGGGAVGYLLGRRASGGPVGSWERYPGWTPIPPERQPTPVQPLPLPSPQRPAVPRGALVVEVLPGTPAQRAGLQVGDIIVAVGNEQVGSQQRLSELIGQHNPGDRVVLSVVRGSSELRVDVRLAENPDNPSQGYLGVGVRDLDFFQP